ncbi:hypothetical protein A3709_02720 [Halioglobus sp. HI00S01]|uniref:hypothetical protein n=1 Tax=Halioglobus sp. HI00S01 TaxID=1822214 RepID=UPI0007C3B323|nr:hypothetical protein [Halioglobus sp. HI00S01]KZX58392.1 hypothetical protein A3709_02720 [Halioglobus sp. HI00S01]
MKTVFIHIGNFKTGSSAIQEYCLEHRGALLSAGFDYILSGRPSNRKSPNHGKIPLSFLSDLGEHTPEWYVDSERFESVVQRVRAEIENSSAANIILSSEEFYFLGTRSQVVKERAKESFQALFHGMTVKTILFVREPYDFICSWYNQANKSQSLRPNRRFTDFFFITNDKLMLPRETSDFWRDCFGYDSAIILPYRNEPQEHLNMFKCALGMECQDFNASSPSRVNVSGNLRALEINRLNKIRLVWPRETRRTYLRSQILTSRENMEKLHRKVDQINERYESFCREEGLPAAKSRFTMNDLIVHEELVNRNDAILDQRFFPFLGQVLKLLSVKSYRKLKRALW